MRMQRARTVLELTVWEGRYHLVKRLLEKVGHPVLKLKRLAFGPLSLGRLTRGVYRMLTPDEVAALKEAVGLKLAHDLTQIIPGKYKGAAFRKGQVIRKGDIPRLLDMGKKQIYVLKLGEGDLHENEAALQMARAITGNGLSRRGPREGKIDFLAKFFGLFKVNRKALQAIDECLKIDPAFPKAQGLRQQLERVTAQQ